MNITLDRKLNFENQTLECSHCEDGKNYCRTETCKTCRGEKKHLKGTRQYKCKTCRGRGYTFLEKPIHDGDCRHCKGTRRVPLTLYNDMTPEDKLWIFENLFNFEKPYTKAASSFNEGYLGLGIVCGVTDYGRYKKMTPEEFRQEVKESFMNHWCQYVSILDKTGNLPSEILIRKGDSGWHAYPVYATQKG